MQFLPEAIRQLMRVNFRMAATRAPGGRVHGLQAFHRPGGELPCGTSAEHCHGELPMTASGSPATSHRRQPCRGYRQSYLRSLHTPVLWQHVLCGSYDT